MAAGGERPDGGDAASPGAERADLAGGQVTSRREGDQWVVRATVPQPGQQAGQQAGQQTQRPQQQEQA